MIKQKSNLEVFFEILFTLKGFFAIEYEQKDRQKRLQYTNKRFFHCHNTKMQPFENGYGHAPIPSFSVFIAECEFLWYHVTYHYLKKISQKVFFIKHMTSSCQCRA